MVNKYIAGIPEPVIDAWRDLAQWLQNELPVKMLGTDLPDCSPIDVGDINACDQYNFSGGTEPAAVVWESDGNASFALSSMSITQVDTVTPGAVEAGDGATVYFPLTFHLLEVKGDYSFSQNCKSLDTFTGKPVSKATADGRGTFIQSMKDCPLRYVAQLGDRLTLKEVVLGEGGSTSMTVTPQSAGWLDKSWFVKLLDFRYYNESRAVRAAFLNGIKVAGFSGALLNLLNDAPGVRQELRHG
ncbi:hypothetical protein ACL02U_27240 [Streptomyces sp. MS06]|uniref:hypothetical protein n=1 Tax=Streptomyces sp. MS06 TaxID=3385974 RepID=UPI0039A06590